MKNIKSFNPIVLARNAIAATGLMTILNIIVDAFAFQSDLPLIVILSFNGLMVCLQCPS